MSAHEARFSVGQVIHHRLFNYRGVVIDVDPVFEGAEEWYDKVALSRPPRDRPWYHVLVDGFGHHTYVAERNLELDTNGGPISHPDLDTHFDVFENGAYRRKLKIN